MRLSRFFGENPPQSQQVTKIKRLLPQNFVSHLHLRLRAAQVQVLRLSGKKLWTFPLIAVERKMRWWGSRIDENVVATGQFFCPKCGATRLYVQKRVVRYIMLYSFRLFAVQRADEFVECQACCETYQLEALRYNPLSAIDRLLASARYELESGLPAQLLQKKLVRSGMNAAGAEKVVRLATGGAGSAPFNK